MPLMVMDVLFVKHVRLVHHCDHPLIRGLMGDCGEWETDQTSSVACLHIFWSLAHNHADGKQTQCLVDDGCGVVEAVEDAGILA